jgi:hypothetical protein
MLDESLLPVLLTRLERISADSYWAHRASGVRGALLRMQSRPDPEADRSGAELDHLLDLGFHILVRAAEEEIR